MTEEDLLHIEVSLRIQLPAAYKHRMQSYPIPLLAGNKDRELWDNADALIKLNSMPLSNLVINIIEDATASERVAECRLGRFGAKRLGYTLHATFAELPDVLEACACRETSEESGSLAKHALDIAML